MDAQEEINQILEKHGLKPGYQMVFPQYKILPDHVKLAIMVLEKEGMVIQFTLTPIDKKE